MADNDDPSPTGPSEPPIQGELPMSDSPPLSQSTAARAEPKVEARPEMAAPPPRPMFGARQKRRALLAAAVVLAAGIGGAVGAFATASWLSPPRPQQDAGAAEERKALQHSIAQLGKQVAALKSELDKSNRLALDKFNKITADLANKPAGGAIAKTADRADRVDIGKSGDITGSVPAPSPAAPAIAAPAAAPATAMVPLPPPRPATRVALAPSRPVVLQGWRIYDAQGGYIFVAGHGEIFQVTPGAPLPGLGPVQSVRREDGVWVVVTPKGLIVADRDRYRFE